MKTKVRVKICCISSMEEAKAAIESGASALGLVGKMPSGPGVIDDDLIARIARLVPPAVSTFLLTSETKPEDIVAHYNKVYTSTIQLVDALEGRDYKTLRKELPGVKLVQVIHVLNENSVAEAIEISESVDAILLDSGNPNLNIKELGGTGRIHNWQLSRKIRKQLKVPVFLAGGLNSQNLREAVETVQPFAIDICSGVRTHGKRDKEKLEVFFEVLNKVSS